MRPHFQKRNNHLEVGSHKYHIDGQFSLKLPFELVDEIFTPYPIMGPYLIDRHQPQRYLLRPTPERLRV